MALLKKFFLFIITALVLLLSRPNILTASPLAYPTERLAGQDRVETALAIAQKGWSSAQTVILAEYSDFPDSIAATPFAVSLNAPILLTAGDSLDPRVVKELQQLKPQKVILLGGTGCLKPSIESALDQLSFKWERIGGEDRYATSILLAKYIPSDSLILANGDDFPDALSAATFAGIKQIPIVLTSKTFPASVIQYYNAVKPKHLIIIGGEGVVPSTELAKNNFTVETRLGGQDRYETNAQVVSYMKDACQSNDLFLASGLTFPDAVAGTVLASKLKAPLLLTEKDDIPPAVYSLLRGHMQVEPPVQNTEGGNNSSNSNNNSTSKDNPPAAGKVTASGGLNLRDTPSAGGKVLATVPQGAAVTIVAQQDGWYKATYQSATGWLSAAYVTVAAAPPTSPESAGDPAANSSGNNITLNGKITAAGSLNLRDTPSASGKVLIAVPQGTTIPLTDQQTGWYKTAYQDKTGWISANYIAIIPQTGKVTASGGLILRDAPSSSGKSLLTIPAGSTVVLSDLQGQWYKTTYQSQTGWISRSYVTAASAQPPAASASNSQPVSAGAGGSAAEAADSAPSIDLSVNGTVYILGGTGVISSNAENILKGKASSAYTENLKDFPPLPSEISKPAPSQSADGTPPPASTAPPAATTPPATTNYDPSKEVPLDPYAGIPANSLAGKTIVIDPGHGGPDTGAIGPSNTYEKNNTLPIALDLNDILKQEGAKVILTRDKDVSPAADYSEIADLQARVDIANKSKADLFISIHNDSFSNPDVQGTTTYFSSDNPKQNESLQLANSIEAAVTGDVKTNNRGAKAGVLYVLKNTDMPAVLIEVAFISNPYEEARLQNPTFRKNVAAGILQGIYNYFKNPLPKD